jgi:hypothetical protein
MAFTILGAAHAMTRQEIPTDVASSQADFYGTGEKTAWSVVDKNVGDLAILPAEAVFHLRYGLKMNTFRDVSEPIYFRDFVTMRMAPANIELTGDHFKDFVTGLVSQKDGMHMARRRATVVFTAQWPYATTLVVRGRASRPTRLRVGRGGWLGRRAWGEVQLDEAMHDVKMTIPPGSFDSGIVDIVFERDSDEPDVTLANLHIDDETQYP